jgi:hypothetical protein
MRGPSRPRVRASRLSPPRLDTVKPLLHGFEGVTQRVRLAEQLAQILDAPIEVDIARPLAVLLLLVLAARHDGGLVRRDRGRHAVNVALDNAPALDVLGSRHDRALDFLDAVVELALALTHWPVGETTNDHDRRQQHA